MRHLDEQLLSHATELQTHHGWFIAHSSGRWEDPVNKYEAFYTVHDRWHILVAVTWTTAQLSRFSSKHTQRSPLTVLLKEIHIIHTIRQRRIESLSDWATSEASYCFFICGKTRRLNLTDTKCCELHLRLNHLCRIREDGKTAGRVLFFNKLIREWLIWSLYSPITSLLLSARFIHNKEGRKELNFGVNELPLIPNNFPLVILTPLELDKVTLLFDNVWVVFFNMSSCLCGATAVWSYTKVVLPY